MHDSTAEDSIDGGVEGGIIERTKAKVLEDTSPRVTGVRRGVVPMYTTCHSWKSIFQELPGQGMKVQPAFFS